MKVGVLNDLPVAGPGLSGFGSGAELTIGRFVMEGHRRGHEVDALHPDYTSPRVLAGYDLLVVKNVAAFPRELLEKGVLPRPFIAWPSDYAWTRWRLYFAFQERHRRLPQMPWWERFFKSSLLNVFLSPLHREAYFWAMPGLEAHPSVLSPPPGNYELFKPDSAGWEPGTAATVNGGLDFKGLHNNLSWAYAHPGVRFQFIGAMREAVDLPPNALATGVLPQADVARLLGRVETYVELPKTVQPFNQTSMQGLLSCKRVVTNALMGAASYDWFRKGDKEAARAALARAIPDLWATIESFGRPNA